MRRPVTARTRARCDWIFVPTGTPTFAALDRLHRALPKKAPHPTAAPLAGSKGMGILTLARRSPPNAAWS
jgi:hypothetical protein